MNSNSSEFKWLLLVFMLFFSVGLKALECSKITTTSSANADNTISYIFDKAYPCGQFANGDWWVSPQKKGEAVVIEEMTPLTFYGSNGFMINPVAPNKQAYDNRGISFDKDSIKTLPVKIDYPASIIKVKSLDSYDNKTKCRPCLSYASVLTVLTEPLVNSSLFFRPGYYGTNKVLFQVNADVWKKKLSNRQFRFKSRNTPDISKIIKRYQHVQLEALEDWGADALHPKDNIPNYGASIATDNAESFLRFLVDDFDLKDPDHLSAFINYLQMSVDFYSLASNGFNWKENGGHTNGRKLPLVMGAFFIDDNKFRQALSKSVFSEDQQIYFSKKTNQVLYGVECTEEVYWRSVVARKGDRTCKDPYELIDGGGAEVGGAYQWCCTIKPWTYTAAVLRIMKLEGIWNNDNIFSYVKRWAAHGAITLPDECAPFNGVPSDLGKNFGPDGSGGCIKGKGRWPDLDGLNRDKGGYYSKFADQINAKLEKNELFD